MTTTDTPAPTAAPEGEPVTWDGIIPLAQILAHTRPAYGGETWAEALSAIVGWPSEKETVDLLVATADTDGLFEEPVAVEFDDEDQCWRVSNGMHRITATHLADRPRIRCTTDRDAGSDADEVIELQLQVAAEAWPAGECDDLDYLGTWMRSFRLPDGTWVEMFGGGAFCGVTSYSWYCPHTHADALVQTLQCRARRHQVTITVNDVCCTTIGALLED